MSTAYPIHATAKWRKKWYYVQLLFTGEMQHRAAGVLFKICRTTKVWANTRLLRWSMKNRALHCSSTVGSFK